MLRAHRARGRGDTTRRPRQGYAPWHWATGIEDTFIPQSDAVRRPLDEYDLQQHYRHWREDIDLAAATGFDTIRYGIPWYVVEPSPGRFDWSWTDRVMAHIHDRGLDPIVDLVHYGTPLWLERQALAPSYPERMASYAFAFAARYDDVARCYTPLNEPFVYAELCGRAGRWPPYAIGLEGFASVTNAIAKGIVLTVRALRAVRDDAVIVHVEDVRYVVSEDLRLSESMAPQTRLHGAALELVLGRVDDAHPLHADLSALGIGARDLAWFRANAVDIDILGLNYYPDFSVLEASWTKAGGITTRPIWGGREYLGRALGDYHESYGVPLFVTECSVNERCAATYGLAAPYGTPGRPDDVLRRRWLSDAVAEVVAVRERGVPVIGFTWWPLLDLVNWDYREGTEPLEDYLEPMGLWRLRMDPAGTLRREALEVGSDMRRIIDQLDGLAVPRNANR